MSVLSKLKEAVICLQAGRVTLPYPAQARPVPDKFRGRPIFDAAKCIGCAGCANNCPARAILVVDVCQEIRILQYLGRRCTYCGRCADVCPEQAITMSHEFETGTNCIGDLRQRLDLFMSTCQRCGASAAVGGQEDRAGAVQATGDAHPALPSRRSARLGRVGRLRESGEGVGAQLAYWLSTPWTFRRNPYRLLLAVMNSICRSLPPKHTFAVQPSGTGICSIFLPEEAKTDTPLPVR